MRPRIKERIITTGCALSALFCIVVLLFIGMTIFRLGAPHLTLDFISTETKGAGIEGGILYQILGTTLLIVSAAMIVMPFATAFALLETVFLKNPFKRMLSLSLQLLNSTPSVLFGIIGFIVFTKLFRWEKSWLSGSILLAIMILPTVTVSLVERIKTIPSGYLEVSRSLGFNQDLLVWKIILPYAWGGLLTGLVLGMARAAGETAPILFTAAVFTGATFPTGIRDNPVLALPYHIYNLAQDSYSSVAKDHAWASAAVLMALVIALSSLAFPFRASSHEEAK